MITFISLIKAMIFQDSTISKSSIQLAALRNIWQEKRSEFHFPATRNQSQSQAVTGGELPLTSHVNKYGTQRNVGSRNARSFASLKRRISYIRKVTSENATNIVSKAKKYC